MVPSHDCDSFQPCAVDMAAPVSAPLSERGLVVVALVIHVVDVFLDLLIAVLFLACSEMGLFLGTTCVIFWAWLISSLYIACRGGQAQIHGNGIDSDDDGNSDGMPNRASRFFLNFVQVQIFVEAYRCIWQHADTDYFHTLRLMEAILESAPNSLVQLYALVIWASEDDTPEVAGTLLRLSVFTSFISAGLGLAMWEQRAQFRTTPLYIASVALMRAFEVASRNLTLALFGGATYPDGFWWALLADYLVMVVLVKKHQSVQLTYGIFVAFPLVLVSLEPLVWRREDHAVPKDMYYTVRILEFVPMWVVILFHNETSSYSDSKYSVVWGCEVLAVLAAIGLYMIFPYVWRAARRHELLPDISHGDEDSGSGEIMTNEGLISDSEEDEHRMPICGSAQDSDGDGPHAAAE